ncbi:MAG: sodium:solute symporter family protein [Amoebophilaceae bacterium]|nr:sodium:solute symporter family protein [Amoebophilaceae bacterium]
MSYVNIDNGIVFVFILITLVIGIVAGRNTKTLQDYAIANRVYGTTTLVLTYLATDIGGGSVLSDAASVFTRGIIVNISITSLIITFIIRAIFIAPKIAYFKNCLTMGEVMGSLYGTFARVLTGMLGCLNATILAGIQLIALGIICESLLGIRATYGIVIGSLLITFYATWGGIKAITLTDVFQFIVLIVFIPLIASIALKEVGGINELFTKLPSEKLMILGHERFYRYVTYFFIWLFQLGMMDPAIVQRMLMASSKYTLRNKYLIIACFDPIFRFIVMLIGLAGYVLYPSIAAKWIVPHIVQTLLPVGLKGLAITGLLAVVMSSADSYIHVAGLTFIHDIVSPFCQRRSHLFNALSWVRYATVCVGFIATMIGISVVDISYLGFKALELIGPMLMFPFVAGVVGLRPEKKPFFIALVCTLIAFIISTLLLPDLYSPLAILISTVTNGMTFFCTHFYINKGFKTIDRMAEKYLSEYR